MIAVQMFLYASAALFFGVMVLVAFRMFASDGARRLNEGDADEGAESESDDKPLNVRYRELLELGMVQLEQGEQILIGCGRKAEVEEVLVVTDRRAFIMTRRQGATFFAKHTFRVDQLRPVPSSAGLVGNKIVLSDGSQTAAISSPGNTGILADARLVVRELNNLIRQSHRAPV